MPIVTLEYVQSDENDRIDPITLQSLTDSLGALFTSPPGNTWVSVRYIDRTEYAENETKVPARVKPTFVHILLRTLPEENQLLVLADKAASTVAKVLSRQQENTHIIFAPEGYGRVAFGGKLITDGDQ